MRNYHQSTILIPLIQKGYCPLVLFPDYSKINQNLSGPPPPPTSLNQTSESIVLHNFQKLVSGTWSLNVSRGLVTDFHANFKLLTVNGIDKHFIELLNFQNSNGSSITFNQFSNTPINGFADIKIDDELFQSKFPLTIQIFNINTIVLTIKDETVSNIFYNNNLLGITDSFKNFKGDELLIFERKMKNNNSFKISIGRQSLLRSQLFNITESTYSRIWSKKEIVKE